jgi:hypothetical protein
VINLKLISDLFVIPVLINPKDSDNDQNKSEKQVAGGGQFEELKNTIPGEHSTQRVSSAVII